MNSVAGSLKEIGNTITLMQDDITVKWDEMAIISADVLSIKEMKSLDSGSGKAPSVTADL